MKIVIVITTAILSFSMVSMVSMVSIPTISTSISTSVQDHSFYKSFYKYGNWKLRKKKQKTT